MMSRIRAIPFLLFAVLAYSLSVYIGGVKILDHVLVGFRMPSEDHFFITVGGLLMLSGLALLFVEILQATSRGRIKWVNQSLATLVLMMCCMLWLVAPRFGTQTFVIITSMALLDVISAPAIMRMMPASTLSDEMG